ncbi:MAG: hypothetical protein JXB47_15535 [Anaerolineae bacterium]|nr:hypothetical protein [Anaerolineae bacterium]
MDDRVLVAAMVAVFVIWGALLWPRLYDPLAHVASKMPVTEQKQTLAIVLAAVTAGIAATVPDLVLLAIVCGVMVSTDLLYHHLSLPLQGLAIALALARLSNLDDSVVYAHLGIGVALALIYLFLAGFDRNAGLGDATVMALIGLTAGFAAPVIVVAGTISPLAFVMFRRVKAREPQPLGGWWLAIMLAAAPLTVR